MLSHITFLPMASYPSLRSKTPVQIYFSRLYFYIRTYKIKELSKRRFPLPALLLVSCLPSILQGTQVRA